MPTDDRFKELHPEQKMLLFYGYLENPTPEEMHKAYRDQSTGPSISKRDEEHLKKLGYSSDKIARMKEELKKAGL